MKCKKMEKAELEEDGEEKADVCDQDALAVAVKAGKDEEKNSGKQQSTGLLHLIIRVPFILKEHHP